MNKNINIPGRLHSVATDGQVAGANEIYDDEQQKFQGEINAELHEEMEDTKEVVDSFDDRVKAIEDLAEISIEGGQVQVANTAEEIVAGSGKVPTANAVAPLKEDILLGAVYDVSAKNPTAGPNNNGKWESLSALLSSANLNTLIPTSVRKGGMSIKFVQSSDNKYVQYRLMKNTWSTIVSDWYKDTTIDDIYPRLQAVGKGSTIVASSRSYVVAGNNYRLFTNNFVWNGSLSNVIVIKAYDKSGNRLDTDAFRLPATSGFVADNYYDFRIADNVYAIDINIRADANTPIDVYLLMRADTKSISNDIELFTNSDVSFAKTQDGYNIILSYVHLQSKWNAFDFYSKNSVTYNTSNGGYLCFDNDGTITQVSSMSDAKNHDYILLRYSSGTFVGGLLYPYWNNYKINKIDTKGWNTIVKGTNVIFNQTVVSWDELKITTIRGTTTIGATSINGNPYLIERNGNIRVFSTLSSLTDTDNVLAIFDNGIMVYGLLLPYWNRQFDERFKNENYTNVYRKVEQIRSLKWTPKATVEGNESVHPAGVEVVGVPYSSAKELRKMVGQDVSLHTFMTAVNNANSLLYTERIGANDSQSAYGVTYHGTNCIAYYGNVCSVLASVALELPMQLSSWEFETQKDLFYILPNQDEQNLKVGDCLIESGHISIITRIQRDNNGIIEVLWLTEQAAPLKTTFYYPYLLKNRRIGNNALWARAKSLVDNINYHSCIFNLLKGEYAYYVRDTVFVETANSKTFYRCKNNNSDAVFTASNWIEILSYNSSTSYQSGDFAVNTVNGESCLFKCIANSATGTWDASKWERVKDCFEWASYPYTYNDDIVTFAGDRASFAAGSLIYLLYDKGDYTDLQIFRNDTLIQTLSLSDTNKVDVSSYCADEGRYKARLTDGTNYSRFTYFEVLDTTVAFNYNSGKLVVDYSSVNATPVELIVCNIGGSPWGHIALNANGSSVVYPQALCGVCKWDSSINEELYARVVFQGDYGNVVSEMESLGVCNFESGLIAYPDGCENFGPLSTNADVYLYGKLNGCKYNFTVTIANSGVSLQIIPSQGELVWDNHSDALNEVGTYVCSITNGIVVIHKI